METILYAEVYLICIIILCLVLYWSIKGGHPSSADRWFRGVLLSFLLNFLANFLFQFFNGGILPEGEGYPVSYILKTIYHITLCVGVFTWCGYSDIEQGGVVFQRWRTVRYMLILLFIPIAVALFNLRKQVLFRITDDGTYERLFMFQFEMGYLLVCTMISSIRLLKHAKFEAAPNTRSYMRLMASFPACILAAWIMSFFGEAFPVICVCIMIEILCLYIGASLNQISMDKLTQVNNRHNLIGYMESKLKNSRGDLYLLMIDLDDFKMINDTYGHLEGDAALVQAAGVLKNACGPFQKRPYIARYGGDEFIVITEAGEQEARQLTEAIYTRLADINRQNLNYQLKLSIGMVKREPEMSYKEWIDAADEKMYQIKKEKKGYAHSGGGR